METIEKCKPMVYIVAWLVVAAVGVALTVYLKHKQVLGSGAGMIAWIWSIGSLTLLFTALGRCAPGGKGSLLIDGRNKVSLSRVQVVSWTILILGGFYAAVCWNIQTAISESTSIDEALNVEIGANLLILMGISGGSFLLSPFILALKSSTEPDDTETIQMLEQLGKIKSKGETINTMEQAEPYHDGKVLVNKNKSEASWCDLLTPEKIGKSGPGIDFSRVQMVLFTGVALVVFAAVSARMFYVNTGIIATLPALSPGILALIAISHGGYLARKAIDDGK